MSEWPAFFVRTLPRLFINSHHDLQSGNTHLQLLHTGLFVQVVHKCWDQVTAERGLMKIGVSYFNTSIVSRERAKTANKGGKLENYTQISPVVFGMYSVLQKRTHPQVQIEVALSGNTRLHLLGSRLIHICASNLF